MNNEEIQALMQQLQSAGLTPEDIADGILWPLFRDGKMSKEDLSTLCSAIGLELDENFENDDGPAEGDGPAISKEEIEDLKEVKPGESKEEFAEKVEDAKAGAPAPAEEADKGDDAADNGEGDEPKADEGNDDAEWDDVKKNIFKL